jgi:hypothetical protein
VNRSSIALAQEGLVVTHGPLPWFPGPALLRGSVLGFSLSFDGDPSPGESLGGELSHRLTVHAHGHRLGGTPMVDVGVVLYRRCAGSRRPGRWRSRWAEARCTRS